METAAGEAAQYWHGNCNIKWSNISFFNFSVAWFYSAINITGHIVWCQVAVIAERHDGSMTQTAANQKVESGCWARCVNSRHSWTTGGLMKNCIFNHSVVFGVNTASQYKKCHVSVLWHLPAIKYKTPQHITKKKKKKRTEERDSWLHCPFPCTVHVELNTFRISSLSAPCWQCTLSSPACG